MSDLVGNSEDRFSYNEAHIGLDIVLDSTNSQEKVDASVDALVDTINKWLEISDILDTSIRPYCKIKGVNR